METQLLQWIHAQAGPGLDRVFVASHWFGGEIGNLVLVVGAVLWHRRRGEAGAARIWLAIGLSTLLLSLGLKAVLGRARPELWPHLVDVNSASFPSGHALSAATFFPLLAHSLAGARPTARAALWAAALAIALWVGVGRLYLGVHWPSDVLAGWALGAAQVAIALRRWPAGRSG